MKTQTMTNSTSQGQRSRSNDFITSIIHRNI